MNWPPSSSRPALTILEANALMKITICKIRFSFCLIAEHHVEIWTLPDPERQLFVSFANLEVPDSLSFPWNISPLLLLYLFPNIPLFLFQTIALFLFKKMMRLFCKADATWAPFYSSLPFVLFIWQASPPHCFRLSELSCRSHYCLCEALTHLRVHL